jgi:hypothetical protein
LVQRIVRAYDEHKIRVAEEQMSLSLENKASTGNGKALPVLGSQPLHSENLENESRPFQEVKREELPERNRETSRSDLGGSRQLRNQE